MVNHAHPIGNFFMLFAVFIFLSEFSSAQLTVVQGPDMGLTPEQLVRDYLIGKGVAISNVTLNGSAGVITKNHIGHFNAAEGAFGQLNMQEGIIMTTGTAEAAIGPNNKPSLGSRSNTGSDPDLEAITGYPSFDACIIEFDFIPQCDTLRFRYAFGSEEFPEFCGKVVNDAFGFFLSGPGIHGYFSNNSTNMARMPGSSEFVTINNICSDPASAWNNNSGIFFQYDAITYVFTAWHIIVPYQKYHLKMAIADNSDQIVDSGVFLEKGSFSAGFDFNISNISTNPLSGPDAIEGCNDVVISFLLPQPAQTELEVNFTLEGNALNGIDYETIPTTVYFQTGEDSAAVIIHPIMDGNTEGTETVIMKILKKTCQGMLTVPDTIIIRDNLPMAVSAGNDITICPGDTVMLIANVKGGVAPFTYSWNHTMSNDSIFVVSPSQGINIYSVNVTDLCSIQRSDTVLVKVEQVAFLTNQPPSKAICDGKTTGITLLSNITSAFFSWEPLPVSGNVTGYSAGTGNAIEQVLNLGSEIPGTLIYRIQVMGDGCDTSFTDFEVTVNPLPVVELGDTIFMNTGSTTDLHAGGGFSDYLWSTGSADSVILVNGPGLYWVQVKNGYSCYGNDTIIVYELGQFIPNAFTPNGDGLNDKFRIQGFDQNRNALLQIFNRWGVLVFETTDLINGWDGTYRNTPCSPGTYVWIIRFRASTNKVYTGTVSIVK
jgi:gliding motility-associated-like protein